MVRYRFSTMQTAFLASSDAAEIRAEYRRQAEKYGDSLRIQTGLRAVFPDLETTLLAACIEAFSLEDAAVRKCAFPAGNLCTREALEMASSARAAALHALLLPDHGTVVDIAAGIGGDALAIARHAEGLVCIEADPVHAHMLAHNLSQAGRRNALVLQGTAENWLPLLRHERLAAVFADPARRDGRKRHINPEDYRPSLLLFEGLPSILPILVKIAPGAEPPGDWDIATVAAGTQCPEQLLSRNCGLPSVCALDADGGESWVPRSMPSVQVHEPRYLIEPHAAIIRTGRVADYLREHRAEVIDAHIAYGWSEEPPLPSRWHQSFKLLRVEPFNRKGLRRLVAEMDLGPSTEIKKRGFPETTDELRAQLKLRGTRQGVIIITRREQGHLMMIAERYA